MKYQILDWAGNVKFNGLLFDTFEDAWGHIYEQLPEDAEDEDFQEFQVIEVD